VPLVVLALEPQHVHRNAASVQTVPRRGALLE